MLETYLLYFFRRALHILGGIYDDPRKLAVFCLLIVVSFVVSLREYRKDRDEGPIWGRIFSNTLWLSLGLGLPIAGIMYGAGGIVRALGMGRPGRALLRLAKYVLFPFKLHLIDNHHAKSDGATTFWTVAVGWWAAAIETLLGLFYCLTLMGIPFGIKHLKLAFVIWGPHRFRVLTDMELDELMELKQSHGERGMTF